MPKTTGGASRTRSVCWRAAWTCGRAGFPPTRSWLARTYVCWCFFNGDTAQHTGDLDAADRWFAQVAEASGDDEDGAAMRAFASYQRADVWIPSDTGRSLQADSAIKKS